MLQGPAATMARASTLRREMSLPEVKPWQILRKRPGGRKFRRQHPSGPYVTDFYCHEARLIVEIDGEAHDRGDRLWRDTVRDAWFASRGLKVMRLTARDVLTDTDAVVRGIVEAAMPLDQE